MLSYVPPHPQKGTKYHRYTLIAYEQPNAGSDTVNITVDQRDAFDVKALAQAHGLEPRGVSFFRQVWDESVSKIYSDVLRKLEIALLLHYLTDRLLQTPTSQFMASHQNHSATSAEPCTIRFPFQLDNKVDYFSSLAEPLF